MYLGCIWGGICGVSEGYLRCIRGLSGLKIYRNSIENLSKIYVTSEVRLGCVWGVSGVYLGCIWVNPMWIGVDIRCILVDVMYLFPKFHQVFTWAESREKQV